MNKRKPTIVDIASALGISPSTVSKALSDHPRISESTKEKVSRAAMKLGYRRNSMATGLRMGKSGLIGVMVPWINLNFFSTVIKGIEDVLSAAGYRILIGQSKDLPDTEAHQLNAFLNAQVEGIIVSIAANTEDYSHFEKVIETGTKLVLFDRTTPELDVDQIIIDDFKGGYEPTMHLLEQGYRRIGVISGPLTSLPYLNRVEGHKAALQQAGIPFDPSLVIESEISIDSGQSAANEFLGRGNPPDAFFCFSDFLALGALNLLLKRNKKVPQEFGLVGFSNEDFTTYVEPNISSVEQFSEEMGQMAARAMIKRLVEENALEYGRHGPVYTKQMLTPKLLVRNSSKIVIGS